MSLGQGYTWGQGKQQSRCGENMGPRGVIRHSQSRGLPCKGHRQENTSIRRSAGVLSAFNGQSLQMAKQSITKGKQWPSCGFPLPMTLSQNQDLQAKQFPMLHDNVVASNFSISFTFYHSEQALSTQGACLVQLSRLRRSLGRWVCGGRPGKMHTNTLTL